ncbi:MAG: LuxR C-terminal-related transcriptional regulator [Bacteroidota bacterium]
MKVILLDTPNLVSDALAFLIKHTEGFELVGHFGSVEELLTRVGGTLGPDLFIVDVELSGTDGLQAARMLKSQFPLSKLLILTLREETFFVNRAILAGADGYVLKNSTRTVFEETIQQVLNDCEFVCSNRQLKDLVLADKGITTREEDILRLVAQGKSSKDIASILFISSRTVDTHRNNLKRKLGLQTSGELVRFAMDHGLL